MFAGNYGYLCGINLYVIMGRMQDWSYDYLTSFDPVYSWLSLPPCAFAWEDEQMARTMARRVRQSPHCYAEIVLGQLEFYDTGHGVKALPVTLLPF